MDYVVRENFLDGPNCPFIYVLYFEKYLSLRLLDHFFIYLSMLYEFFMTI